MAVYRSQDFMLQQKQWLAKRERTALRFEVMRHKTSFETLPYPQSLFSSFTLCENPIMCNLYIALWLYVVQARILDKFS